MILPLESIGGSSGVSDTMSESFQFNVHIPRSGEGLPAVDPELRRVNLIMGANGSGKTKILLWLARNSGNIFPGYQPIYIEDNRIISPPVGFQIPGGQHAIVDDPQVYLEKQYLINRIGSQHVRLNSLLPLLRELERHEKIRHSDQVSDWSKSGNIGPCPERAIPPLERLFTIFSNIFPDIQLFITEGGQLYCRKIGQSQEYPVSSLSQGEKQAFVTIADMFIPTREPSVFFIDEPELNLHATLVDKLWTSLEERFSKSVFVYATHSLTFAARPSIERAVILRVPPASSVVVDRVLGQKRGILDPFLGFLPAVLAYQKCLLTEGTIQSIDRIFYGRLMAEAGLGVVPVGSASDVLAAVGRREVWSHIAPDANLVGVIDRDFKTDDHLTRIESAGCIVLEFHEVESYLCDPTVIEQISRKLGTARAVITADQIAEDLRSFARETLIGVVARRIFQRIDSGERFSLSREALSRISTEDDLRTMIMRQAENVRRAHAENLSDAKVRRILQEEYNRCDAVIKAGDSTTILRLFEGRRFLERILPRLGLNSSASLAQAVFLHLDLERHSSLVELRNRIRAKLT
jgi:hypothetical protein